MTLEERAFRKATRRLIPFLFLIYVVAYLDRVNVSFAQLQLEDDLDFTDTIFGIGAGIFSLLGAAGEVAGSAVWVSFVLAGVIAALQGYSFAKLGARFPSGAGLLEYVNRGFGPGHVATVTAWLTYGANFIVTAMVALSFGSYAVSALGVEETGWEKLFAIGLVVAMTVLNVAGSLVVARVQSLVVFVVVGILAFFAVVTIANIDPARLAPSTYPGVQDIVSGVALTFFAFLGFGIVTFTASTNVPTLTPNVKPPSAVGQRQACTTSTASITRKMSARYRKYR